MKPVAWLTADQAREYLGLPSLNSLYVWKHRAKPKTHWLRGRMRFRQTDLDACLEVEPQTDRAKLRLVAGERL